MTREQAKREIDNIDFYLQHHTDDYSERSHDAMMMAIQALSQEPCDDAISREYLKKIAQSEGAYGYVSAHDIATAPSVTPSRPTDIEIRDLKWQIASKEQVVEDIKNDIRHIVDEESEHDEKWARGLHYALCIIEKHWNCGAKMVEPQESEET